MRLYPKKLRNIEDLEREKIRLLKESLELDKEDIFSVKGILGRQKEGGAKKEAEDHGMAWMDLLPIGGPVVGQLLKTVIGRFTTKRSSAEKSNDVPGKKSGKNMIRTVAIEVIGGYLKWKAIELSYKGIRHIVRSRKKKTE